MHRDDIDDFIIEIEKYGFALFPEIYPNLFKLNNIDIKLFYYTRSYDLYIDDVLILEAIPIREINRIVKELRKKKLKAILK